LFRELTHGLLSGVQEPIYPPYRNSILPRKNAAALRKLIDEDKFPFSPRLKPLKSALAKLDPGLVRVRGAPPQPPLARF
jgi:hypothetical protein